jgi:putative transposase
MVGIDVGLNYRYTNSNDNQVENLRFLGKGKKALKHLSRRLRRKKKGSNNRTKARNHVGRGIGAETLPFIKREVL